MEIGPELAANTEAEWEALWNWTPGGCKIVHGLSGGNRVSQERSLQACHFIAGSLFRCGFRLFRNGGQPLLERRTGGWIDEILFRFPNTGRAGVYAPLSVQLHTSHPSFAEVRSRYWSRGERPARAVAQGTLGELREPPQRVIWNVAAGGDAQPAVEAVVADLHERALPWMAAFRSPRRMLDRLYTGGMPMVDPVVALEFVLIEFGNREAMQFLETVLLPSLNLREEVEALWSRAHLAPIQGGPTASVARNLAAIAYAFDLASIYEPL